MERTALGGLITLGAFWVAALFASPIAVASPHRMLAVPSALVYEAGSHICHQRPERSFHIGGRPMPVCARCTGLYVSAAAAIPFALVAATVLPSRRARAILLVAALPTLTTWALEYGGIAAFSNLVRALAALPLGFATAWLVIGTLRGRMS
ncbi:MAG TPA: DUF2085 domain-containing protein [Vicinamibacterales bacterium]